MDAVTVTILAVGYVVMAICLTFRYVLEADEPKRRWAIAWLTGWPVILAAMGVMFFALTMREALRSIAEVLRGGST